MSKVAVIYWSGTGNTEMMAKEIAEGARLAGAEVDLFSASNFKAAQATNYDRFALGCPAMGAEELEDSVFLPLYNEMKSFMSEKKTVLFGSYGWGGGEYMDSWKNDAIMTGLNIVDDALAIENAPDDDGKLKCRELGKVLAMS